MHVLFDYDICLFARKHEYPYLMLGDGVGICADPKFL